LFEGKPIPGDEDKTEIENTWVLLIIVNPFNSVAISFLHGALFLACMGVIRPFRVSLLVLAAVFIIEVAVWAPTVVKTGFFELFGVAAICLALFVTYVGVYFFRKLKF